MDAGNLAPGVQDVLPASTLDLERPLEQQEAAARDGILGALFP